jgi:flavorubredoxin
VALADQVIELNGSGVFALPNPFPLDGRPLTSHPASARGFAPNTCYVIREGDSALLIDTGYTIHRDSILRQLGTVVDRSTELSILFLRYGEFEPICNTRPIAEAFDVKVLMSGWQEHIAPWVDFDPRYNPWRSPAPGGALAAVRSETVNGNSVIPIGDGGRTLALTKPELRLLPTFWGFDSASGTLFTSDSFAHIWQASRSGPWVIDDERDDPSTLEQLCEYLLDTRFWWLQGAETESLRESVRAVRETWDIQCIAPGYGCIIRGRELVARHFDLLDEALATLAAAEPVTPDLVPTR